jgi:polar amino acid transport system substrate-binding protein
VKASLILGLLACLSAPLATAADVITIGAEDDWYPYSGTVEMKPKGMAVDIVRAAFKKVGVEVNFQSMPYGRCMADAKAGKIFGCFDVSRNAALEPHYLWHAAPMFRAKIFIYARNDSTETGLIPKNLEDKLVAVTADYEYGDAFDSNTKIKRLVSKHDLQGFRKLLHAKADYALAFEKVANHLFATHKAEMSGKFKVVGLAADVGLYIGVGKTYPNAAKYVALFNQGFEAIQKDGKYAAIEKSWE